MALKKYEVLIPCRSDDTGKSYEPGDRVSKADFPEEVIENWLNLEDPVLAPVSSYSRKKKNEADDQDETEEVEENNDQDGAEGEDEDDNEEGE